MNQIRKIYTNEILSLDKIIGNLDRFREKHNFNLHDTLLTFVVLCPLVVAGQFTQSENLEMRKSNAKLGHAANFLWMVREPVHMEKNIEDFQTALILPMDDPDNPSLRALTHTLETGNEIDALRAALKEHVGPLHHGAGTLAMEMFEEIKDPETAKQYLEEKIASGGKIYGLGHRIYKGIDPRAVLLREILENRVENTDDEWILHVSEAVANEGGKLLASQKGIKAHPNIDLYNAAVYSTLGIPPEWNTLLFAISRAAGWMAHILELIE
jgi:citrate synthase